MVGITYLHVLKASKCGVDVHKPQSATLVITTNTLQMYMMYVWIENIKSIQKQSKATTFLRSILVYGTSHDPQMHCYSSYVSFKYTNFIVELIWT